MALIQNCLAKLVKQGKITQGAANAALGLHQGIQGRLGQQVPPTHANALAALQAAQAMASAAQRRKLNAAKQAIRYAEVEQRVLQGKGSRSSRLIGALTRGLYEGGENVEAKAEVILAELFKKAQAFAEPFRSKAAGLSSGARGQMEHFVRELFGQKTGNSVAQQAAKAWQDASEYGTKRALQAGKDFAEMQDWRLPQFWERSRVRRHLEPVAVAEKRFTDAIHVAVNRGGLELMNKNTGAPASAMELPAVIKAAFDDIVHRSGSPGHGGGFSRDMRVFRFKDADTWLEFQREFGPGSDVDIFNMLTSHLEGMAREIALTEILGPQHWANFRALHKLAGDEHEEKGSLAKFGAFVTVDNPAVADIAYRHLTGQLNVVASEVWGGFFGGLRNIQTASKLGSAVVTAVPGDSVLSFMAARHNGMSGLAVVNRAIRQILTEDTAMRQQMARMNIVSHAVMDTVMGNRRFQDEVVGSGVTGQLASFVIRAQGLQAWTEGLKRAFSMEFMAHIAENRGKAFGDLDVPLRRFLEHHKFTSADWDTLRSAPVLQTPDGAEFFMAEAVGDRRLAERLVGAIIDERRFAVIEPDARVRAVTTGGLQRGTFWGEVARSTFMFKSFAISMLLTHTMRAMTTGPWWSRPYRFAGQIALMTMAGAAAMQTRHVLFGRDPQPMDRGEFWFEALAYGGGLGIYGDFIYQATSQSSGTGAALAVGGPAAQALLGPLDMAFSAVRALRDGSDPNFGRNLAKFVERNTPGSSLWYARLAADRMIFDQFQSLIDDQYWDSFAREQDRYRDAGTSFWFPPGQTAPERAPNLSNALPN